MLSNKMTFKMQKLFIYFELIKIFFLLSQILLKQQPSAKMQKNKANKWQTSLNQIKKAKLRWRQFSVDKGSVLDHMKSISFPELQEMYNNLPDYFWRDNGEFFINYIFKVILEVESICFSQLQAVTGSLLTKYVSNCVLSSI